MNFNKVSLKEIGILLALLISMGQSSLALAHVGLVRQWNTVALQAIRDAKPAPTVVARALAVTYTCMFDAWAAYDANAVGTRFGVGLRRPVQERTLPIKEKAISFAAYTCLRDLFPKQTSKFDSLMAAFGYDVGELPENQTDPIYIGKKAANAVLRFRHNDGANQLGDLNPGAYSDYTGYTPVNTPTKMGDPDHWQPLLVNGTVQKFATPHWGGVKPYALSSGKQFRHLMRIPASYKKEPRRYREQAQQLIEYSASLTDEKKAIAEYWADGPNSELPPGHWAMFASYISERDKHTLDKDVKLFFALSNALFDAGIAAWDSKRFYDCVRPISAIHFLYAGKKINSWKGPVKGEAWQPYQAASFLTPPFPEYGSGHSTFSAAGAETLRLFTGSDYFGHSAIIRKGSSRVQPGVAPSKDIRLYWASFSDAADEAGISRRYGGIHFIDGDMESRKIGRLVGRQAWAKTQKYFGLVR